MLLGARHEKWLPLDIDNGAGDYAVAIQCCRMLRRSGESGAKVTIFAY
jgi:hypothetical protein